MASATVSAKAGRTPCCPAVLVDHSMGTVRSARTQDKVETIMGRLQSIQPIKNFRGIRMDFFTKSLVLCATAAIALGTELPRKSANATEGQQERGAYLVNSIVACGNCHTPKGPDGHALADQELSGRFMVDLPGIHAVAPTSPRIMILASANGPTSRSSTRSAMGSGQIGTVIGPAMPIVFYRNMSDSDVLAIVAYLRSVKAANHAVEKSTYKNPLPESYGPTVDHVAGVAMSDRAAYGANLASIGHCMACHTPMVNGKLDMSRAGAGGRELPAPGGGTIISANLTSANSEGVSKWTDAEVKNTITTGVRPDGRRLVSTMAFDWYKNMRQDDLRRPGNLSADLEGREAVIVGYSRTRSTSRRSECLGECVARQSLAALPAC